MNRWTITATVLLGLASSSACPVLAKTGGPPPEPGVNRGVVELETARGAGISVRIAEDLANVMVDAAGSAGHRQGCAAEHYRSQAAARRRHGDPPDRCARLRAAAKPVSRYRE